MNLVSVNLKLATVLVVFTASTSIGMNQTLTWCRDTFLQCALAIANDSYAGGQLQGCQEDFQDCSLNYNTSQAIHKSEECYLADAGWMSAKVIAGLTAGAFVGVVILLPHGLALYAHCMNSMAQMDPLEHPYLSGFGKWVVKVRDADGDGKLSGADLLKPQVAYGVVGIGFLADAINKAYEMQARCDFTRQQCTLVTGHCDF